MVSFKQQAVAQASVSPDEITSAAFLQFPAQTSDINAELGKLRGCDCSPNGASYTLPKHELAGMTGENMQDSPLGCREFERKPIYALSIPTPQHLVTLAFEEDAQQAPDSWIVVHNEYFGIRFQNAKGSIVIPMRQRP